VDAFPDRQDLRVDLLRLAVDEGTTISIGSDTHWPGQLGFVDFGLAAALEAGVAEGKILNLLDVESLLAWVEQLKDLQNYASA
jgi:histidinol phosphatase-like PHP family hydrolase